MVRLLPRRIENQIALNKESNQDETDARPKNQGETRDSHERIDDSGPLKLQRRHERFSMPVVVDATPQELQSVHMSYRALANFEEVASTLEA